MSDDTIREDVPADDSSEEQREPSARELAMERVASMRRENFTAETGVSLESPQEAPIEDESAELDQAQQEIQDTIIADHLDRYKVKAKVDGQELEVPLDEVIRKYQKNSAADRRLAEATRLLNEAREAQMQPVQQAEQQSGDAQLDARELVEALFEGNADKATELLATLGKGRREAPTLDPDMIAAQIAPRIKQQMVVESALEQSRKDYPQLYADPDMEALGASKINRRMNEGESFVDALSNVAKEMSEKFGWSGSRQSEPDPTTARIQKLERKAAVEPIRTANVSVSSTEEPTKSASDIINEMKRARGF